MLLAPHSRVHRNDGTLMLARALQLTPDPMSHPIRFVLVRTSHPGNIGAAARAIRTMGFQRLSLVAPHRFPHAEAVAMAAGADEVLDQAAVSATLVEAVADCTLVLGCTARRRVV